MSTNGVGNGVVDLSSVIPVDTIEHEVLAPDGSRTGWIITLCDASYPKAQAHLDEERRRRMRKERLQEQAMVNGRKYHAEELSVEEDKARQTRWLVSRVVGWTTIKLPFISPDPITFSDDAAMRVFMHPKAGFVVSQLVDTLTADKAFMPRSPKESEISLSASSHYLPESPTEPVTANS